MKLEELFKNLAKGEHVEEESMKTFRLFASVKKEFTLFADTIHNLRPSEYGLICSFLF